MTCYYLEGPVERDIQLAGWQEEYWESLAGIWMNFLIVVSCFDNYMDDDMEYYDEFLWSLAFSFTDSRPWQTNQQ